MFYENISKGLTLFTIGLFKKVVLADRFAAIATPVFDSALGGNTIELANGWMACSAYTLQLYFDFSGYTDMAIGLGLMFGYRLPINFNVPYRAGSIHEFWQRWHITLSRFLRDYVYISLGGNRHGFPRQLAAVFVTMLLGGLWHGAGWTYVIWGGMHGLGLVVHRCWQGMGLRLPRLIGWVLTMLFVMFSFVLFRAESFAGAWEVARGMLGFNGFVTVGNEVDERFWRLMSVGALIATVGPSSYQVAVERSRPAVWKAVLVGLVLVCLILETGSGGHSEFICFQFWAMLEKKRYREAWDSGSKSERTGGCPVWQCNGWCNPWMRVREAVGRSDIGPTSVWLSSRRSRPLSGSRPSNIELIHSVASRSARNTATMFQ